LSTTEESDRVAGTTITAVSAIMFEGDILCPRASETEPAEIIPAQPTTAATQPTATLEAPSLVAEARTTPVDEGS
jgi:hypothetical protein